MLSRPRELAQGKRPLLALLALLVVLACVLFTNTFIAITPRPGARLETERDTAFAIVERILAKRAFGPWVPVEEEQRTSSCFMKDHIVVCGEMTTTEVHFALTESFANSLSLAADTLRRELLDSLRVTFGSQQVKGCERRDDKKVLSRCSK